MTVQITYDLTKQIDVDLYTVTFTVIDAQQIERGIFVVDSASLEFTGVATVYDMITWPADLDENLMSYRSAVVSRSFPSLEQANSFDMYTRGRILRLQREWQEYLDGFPAEETIQVPTPD